MPRAEDGKDGFVLAVDPGGHTGVAWLAGEQFGSGVIDGGRFEFHRWFTNVVNTIGSPIAIVCENFIVTASTARKTAQPDPYLIIGWLELWSHQHGVPFTLQTPSTGKGFGTDAKLKHMGWWRTGNGGHDNDAARHLLTYLARERNPYIEARLKEMEP